MLETAEIMPLTGALGAEVSGVQLANLVKRNDSSNAEQLFQMLVENKVLVFRDQHPDPQTHVCLLYTSPSPRDRTRSRMPSSA